MALIIGTDSYATAAECATYLAANYITTDAKLIAWNLLSADNKDVLLRQAAKLIDRQPLQGYKYLSTQTMEFPRYIYTESNYDDDYLHPLLRKNGFYSDGSVPQAVKDAQCEIAISMISGTSERAEMQRQGVKSFSLGSLSESYTGNHNAIPSYEAKQLLQPYLGGGFRVG